MQHIQQFLSVGSRTYNEFLPQLKHETSAVRVPSTSELLHQICENLIRYSGRGCGIQIWCPGKLHSLTSAFYRNCDMIVGQNFLRIRTLLIASEPAVWGFLLLYFVFIWYPQLISECIGTGLAMLACYFHCQISFRIGCTEMTLALKIGIWQFGILGIF